MDARRLIVCAVSLCAVVASPLALTTPSTAAGTTDRVAGPDGETRLLAASAHGRAAIAALGGDLEVAAARNHLSVTGLRDLLATDKTAWLNRAGQLYYVEPTLGASALGVTTQDRSGDVSTPYTLNETFALHSKPGSNRTIYLDFDGQTIAGSIWNANSPLPDGFYGGWSTDEDASTFSSSERATIQSIWQRVAEDYAPFDVDVTTSDPGADALTRSDSGDQTFGTRALFTASATARNAVCQGTCGGVAYVGTFDAASNTLNYMQPAWIFPQGLGPNNAKFMAEAAAHEVGHTLGLGHDGTSSQGYYVGQGSWAPIMGVAYGEPITQWSKGEYADANNQQDDYAVMESNGLANRPDEAGGTVSTAAPFSGKSVSGYITEPGDQDVYAVDRSCSTPFTATARPAPTSPDLDIRLTMRDGSGALLATENPASGGSGDVATGLSAATGYRSGPGLFYLAVDGVGHGNPATTGYSDYGSLGQYSLTLSNTCTVGPPTAPRSLTTSIDDFGGSVVASWAPPASDGSAAISAYRVRENGVDVATLGPNQRSYTFTGLARGAHLAVAVRAVNANGDGPLATTTAVLAPRPGAPRRFTAARGSHQVVLRWAAPRNAAAAQVTRYRVRMLSANGTPVSSTSLRARARSFTWGGLTNGKAYGFSVTAVSGNVESRPSTVTSVVPARAPSHPRSLSANVQRFAHGRVVHLRWTAPESDGGLPVTGYRITKLLLGADGRIFRRIVTSVSGRTLRHDVVVPRAGRWAFQVRAVNAVGPGGSSHRSNVVRVT